jgi:hypothetical protein
MNRRSLEKLRDELRGLMLEHIESLKTQTFVGRDEEGLRQQEELLKRIRKCPPLFWRR